MKSFRAAGSLHSITVITEAELRCGVGILPEGRRRTRLAAELDKTLQEELGRRVLPFDRAAARSFATIGAARRAAGLPISHADFQIAAIARSRGRVLHREMTEISSTAGSR